MLTREDGERIARKLGATIENGRQHDLVVIRHQGKRVAGYGMTRSSRETNLNYLPRQLHVSAKQCRDLSECPLSAEEYFKILDGKHLL